MSDLLWQFKWWRYIVSVTKGNPKVMTAVSISCIGTFVGLAWLAQTSTEKLKTPLTELKETSITPRERQRYAKAGQEAFASLVLSQLGPEKMSPEHVEKATVPLPPIAWHPKAIQREENTKSQ
ncbi:hypothetical protein Gasu2_65120 [Galdieria sulphuraria]|uniref:Uncharacterized protein n=1 Tax=Galdieria sulphuraria TaxID=130081 RepID=M2Y5H3_GALSU|nr:uncharacterized protein Gasu_16040 [Galdieria sulphuraria]EME31104.1 hypothetical protein Gasu_16040 [Galdieria sulphuraria]GJD12427.1 hypothetical protein Gasu2_65120 [Galdieria sulphuraria]|eukprot:XP_005707624.1 hypothetical protein Gasu_16040 [Galdieria sulphuraria]